MIFNRLKQQQLSGKKKKLVAWYVARCGSVSEREGYITELKVSSFHLI